MIDTIRTTKRISTRSSVPPALLARVQAAIAELPDEQRLALALRKGARMSYRQIADVLQCDEALARQATYSAIRTLRSWLANDLSAADPGPARATERGHRVPSMKGETK